MLEKIMFGGLLLAFITCANAIEKKDDAYHVYPEDQIQDALRLASEDPEIKVVKVHPGIYRPNSKRQALIWLNRRHEGIQLIAVGNVTLTAANPSLSNPDDPSHPAVVNHVIYIGNGISNKTVVQGFKVTGANGFVIRRLTHRLEPDRTLPKNLFFYADGGGIKIFGRSYPTLIGMEVFDNFTSPCGAGISVQHEGYNDQWVILRDCIIRGNRTQVTGSGVDLLPGSAGKMINCLFVGNISNTGQDVVANQSGEKPFKNSGALTIFSTSKAIVENCTFTGNRNAVDDMGNHSVYRNSIFFENTLESEFWMETQRYELMLTAGAKEMKGCFIRGKLHDVHQSISKESNRLNAPDPRFDSSFVPQSDEYDGKGYRPVRDRSKINSPFGGSAVMPDARHEEGESPMGLQPTSNAADGMMPPRPEGLGRFGLPAALLLSHRAQALLHRRALPETQIASSKWRSYF